MPKIVRRIEREVGVTNLSKILAERIKPTDLQSLLMKVYKIRVKRRSPRVVLSDYVSNSFTSPSRCDPKLLLEWDRVAFSHLPDGFHAVELSPLAPLGSVSSIAPINQDWVFTTIRNMEVVADPTNTLALECARQRQQLTQSDPTNATPVHLACSHRVMRAQKYRSAGARQHFRLFSLCSAGRATGNVRFEFHAMTKHIQFYLKALKHFLGSKVPLRVVIIDLAPESHNDAPFKTQLDNLKKEFRDVDITLEKPRNRRTEYYGKLRFHVNASPIAGKEMELVDGGDTNWTQKLLNNAKERLVTSAIGSERLCENFVPSRKSSSARKQKKG